MGILFSSVYQKLDRHGSAESTHTLHHPNRVQTTYTSSYQSCFSFISSSSSPTHPKSFTLAWLQNLHHYQPSYCKWFTHPPSSESQIVEGWVGLWHVDWGLEFGFWWWRGGCERLSGFGFRAWVQGDSSFGLGLGILGEIGVSICDGGWGLDLT